MIHAFSYPSNFLRNISIVVKSIWIQAYYNGEVKKSRYLFVLMAPFTFLTLIPLGLSLFVCHISPVLIHISLINSVLSGGDLLSFYLTITRTPDGTVLRTHRMATYCRLQH